MRRTTSAIATALLISSLLCGRVLQVARARTRTRGVEPDRSVDGGNHPHRGPLRRPGAGGTGNQHEQRAAVRRGAFVARLQPIASGEGRPSGECRGVDQEGVRRPRLSVAEPAGGDGSEGLYVRASRRRGDGRPAGGVREQRRRGAQRARTSRRRQQLELHDEPEGPAAEDDVPTSPRSASASAATFTRG